MIDIFLYSYTEKVFEFFAVTVIKIEIAIKIFVILKIKVEFQSKI